MRGNQHRSPLLPGKRGERLVAEQAVVADQIQRVDDGVAGHHDVPVRNSLGQEIVSSTCGGREMDVGDAARDPPVGFFGKGPPVVPRSKPRLDMPDRNPAVERGQGRGHDGRGVALDQEDVRSDLLEGIRDCQQRFRGELGQRLISGTEAEVDGGRDGEGIEGLGQELAML